MKEINKDRNNVIIGAVIGGLLTGTAYCLWRRAEEENKPFLDKLGKAAIDMGEKLEKCSVDTQDEAVDKIGKSLKKSNTASSVLSWVATGLSIWEQFKKRD